MFWLIETQSQLNSLFSTSYDDVFVEIITNNDFIHNKLSDVVSIYFQNVKDKRGYIISINHPEGLNEIDFSLFLDYLKEKCNNIYVINKKKSLYHLKNIDNLQCIKTVFYIENMELPDITQYNTTAHTFFYSKYYNNYNNINCLIPLSKHYEKYNTYINSIKIPFSTINKEQYKYYNDVITNSLFYIENNGIPIDKKIFKKYFNPKNDYLSIKDDIIYSEYNMFTHTGRPSNAFNGINFSALKKNNNERECFSCLNDYLVEFDYSNYHPKILANIINYDFGEDDVYEHIAKIYYKTDIIDSDKRSEIKKLTFRFLYTDNIPDDLSDVTFFSEIKKLKEYLWDFYKKKKYIISPFTKRKIYNIDSKVKILPYLCQVMETERNCFVIDEIRNLLIGKQSRLILYNFDSFLVDFNKKDKISLLFDIQRVIEGSHNSVFYKTSIKYGKNYNDLQ